MKQLGHLGDVYREIENGPQHDKFMCDYLDGKWRIFPTDYFLFYVKALAVALRDLGLKRGEKIGILADPCSYWTMADLAIGIAGGVSVPLFATLSEENFLHEVNECGLRHIFVSGDKQWRRIKDLDFTTVIGFDGEDHGTHTIDQLVEVGQKVLRRQPKIFDRMIEMLSPNDTATVVYTTGAHGKPRGVILSHHNLLDIAQYTDYQWNGETDTYLNILPLAHIFGRQIGMIMLAWSIPMYFLNNLGSLPQVAREVRPTLSIVVPKIIEKTYYKTWEKIQSGNFISRCLGALAWKIAGAPYLLFKLLRPLGEVILFKKLRNIFGGKLRLVYCGGAALDNNLHRFFLRSGIPIFEGWGQTECSTLIVNRLDNQKIGSIGQVIGVSEAKVSDDGELLIRGPTVFQGYLGHEDETERTLRDGWHHTGDKATIDDEGFVYLKGRINEMFKTSAGKYVSPVPIEEHLTLDPFIDTAVVVGEKRAYATALFFPDGEYVKSMKRKLGLLTLSDEEFLSSSEVHAKVQRAVDKTNSKLNAWEQIRGFKFLNVKPSVDGGELTPTLKVRRSFVQEKYKNDIDSLYREAA